MMLRIRIRPGRNARARHRVGVEHIEYDSRRRRRQQRDDLLVAGERVNSDGGRRRSAVRQAARMKSSRRLGEHIGQFLLGIRCGFT